MTPFSAKIKPSNAVNNFDTDAILYMEWLCVNGDVVVSLPLMIPKFRS